MEDSVDTRIERLAADKRAKIDELSDSLENLSHDPTFLWLRKAEAGLAGETRDRWLAASRAIASVMSRLDRSRKVVDDAARILRDDPGQAGRAEELLRDQSVRLPVADTPKTDRRPLASGSSAPRFTLHAVQDLAAQDLGKAQRLIEEVGTVRRAVEQRLDRLTGRAQEVGSRLGDAEASGLGAELARLRVELADLLRLLASDPLAFGAIDWSGPGQGGAPVLSRLEAAEAELVELTAIVDRLDGLLAEVNELGNLESRARARWDELLLEFTCDVPAVPANAGDLGSRVAALQTRWLTGEADELGHAIKAAQLVATEVTERANDIFKQLLRERLEDYRLSATQRGYASRPDLVAAHHRARALLEEVPCDLTRADQAVHEYMSMQRRQRSGK
jgi:hypothetical protein